MMFKIFRTMVATALFMVMLSTIIASFSNSAHAGAFPQEARHYRFMITAEVRRQWGIAGPIALLSAQIHQESAWDPNAKSKYAIGLTQFTPATASDIDDWYQGQLGGLARYSPLWAIRAMVLYDKRIYTSILPMDAPIEDCDRFAMMLSGYNGGPGWLNRDRKLTRLRGDNPDWWWGGVEKHSNRAGWAIKENRDYPWRIIYRHQKIYHDAWGGKWVC